MVKLQWHWFRIGQSALKQWPIRHAMLILAKYIPHAATIRRLEMTPEIYRTNRFCEQLVFNTNEPLSGFIFPTERI